jgi:hypothetical protein
VFRRLAVFAGGFSLAAASTVVAAVDPVNPLDELDVVDAVGALVDKSLVQLDNTSGGRYRLLETLRVFAADQLTGAGEADQARRAHIDWCIGFLGDAARLLNGPDGPRWMGRVLAEGDNLRAAAQWSMASADAERLIGLLVAEWPIQVYLIGDKSHLALARAVATMIDQEHRRRWRDALATAAWALVIVDPTTARGMAVAALDLDPDADDAAGAQEQLVLASCAMIDGRPDDVERHSAEGMRISVLVLERDDDTLAPVPK